MKHVQKTRTGVLAVMVAAGVIAMTGCEPVAETEAAAKEPVGTSTDTKGADPAARFDENSLKTL